MSFDYEEAELDVLDNGGDPDYLDHYHPEKRDAYLRNIGLRPESYDQYYKSPSVETSKDDDWFFVPTAPQYNDDIDSSYEDYQPSGFTEAERAERTRKLKELEEEYTKKPITVSEYKKLNRRCRISYIFSWLLLVPVFSWRIVIAKIVVSAISDSFLGFVITGAIWLGITIAAIGIVISIIKYNKNNLKRLERRYRRSRVVE